MAYNHRLEQQLPEKMHGIRLREMPNIQGIFILMKAHAGSLPPLCPCTHKEDRHYKGREFKRDQDCNNRNFSDILVRHDSVGRL